MTIYKTILSKEKLLELPSEESSLFLGLAHLSNEIVALTKLVIWTHDFSSDNEAIGDGQTAICLMMIKLMSGKLKEGYNLITKKFFGTKLSLAYDEFLPNECKGILKELNRYFNKHNAVDHVRNNYAFHYTPENLSLAIPNTQEDLVLYFEEGRQDNNLNYFAEVIANRALLQSLEYGNDQEAFDRLITETTKIASWLLEVSSHIMGSFILKHGKDILESGIEEVHFDSLPRSNSVKIPWFIDNSTK